MALPDNVLALLASADSRHDFPAGTMASVMQQEIGGNYTKFLNDPAAYHYEAGPDGRRIAKHTGKESTAFGPFGILESTARDPGYGVKPLQGKNLEEQVRFASDYLAARSKSAGGLSAGLAGYGEGAKYAQQVAARTIKRIVAPATNNDVSRNTNTPAELDSTYANLRQPNVTNDEEVSYVTASSPAVVQEEPAWTAFQQAMPQPEQANPVRSLASYGEVPQMQAPTYASIMGELARYAPKQGINFGSFTGFGARG